MADNIRTDKSPLMLKAAIACLLVILVFYLFQAFIEITRNHTLFGVKDLAYLVIEALKRIFIIPLPFIVLLCGLFMLWLYPLASAISKGFKGLELGETEKRKGWSRLVNIPLFLVLANLAGIAAAVAVRIFRDPGFFLFPVRSLTFVLFMVSVACVSGLLTSSITMGFFAKPASFLGIRYIREEKAGFRLGVRSIVFSIFLIAYCTLFVINESQIMAMKSYYYAHALERLYKEDAPFEEVKTEYAKNVSVLIRVDESRVSFPFDSESQYERPASREMLFFYFVCLMGFALFFTYASSREPIAKINAVIERIGKIIRGGDLTQRIPVTSPDEIGHLASNTNLMINMMTDILRNVSSVSNHIVNAANTIDSNAREMSLLVSGIRSTLDAQMSGMDLWLAYMANADPALKSALATSTIEKSGVREFLKRLETSNEAIESLLGIYSGDKLPIGDAIVVSLKGIESSRKAQEERAREMLGFIDKLGEASETHKSIVGILKILLSGFKY